MLFVPDWLAAIFTFPGVIVHEWAHKKFCDWTGVRVHKVVYFQPKNLAGYVIHDQADSGGKMFWISVGPIIFNSLLCIACGYAASAAPFNSVSKFVLLWLALTIGARAFPSDQDAGNVLERCRQILRAGGSLANFLAYPFYALIWLANKLRFFWFDFLYAALLIALGYALRKNGFLT
jgi:hypothetical protein